MKLQTQFTVPHKQLRDLDYVKEIEILIKARRSAPVYWIWENDQIKRVRFNPLKRKVKTLI